MEGRARELTPEQLHLMWLALFVTKACRAAGVGQWVESLADDFAASELWFQVFAQPLLAEHSAALDDAIAAEVLSEWLARDNGDGPSATEPE